MRTYQEKLNSLEPNSVWLFTKQDTDFDQAFRGATLFSEITDKEHTNIEDYFTKHHARYGINTDRHRMLVIPQMYGLITKTPFFVRGGNYAAENPTEVFDSNKGLVIGSKEYNIFKTEQLLKIKIHAIIDTSNNNSDYNILPIVFIYKVLKVLKDDYGIDKITLDQLYTYVMTCKSYSELDEAVSFIKDNAPISPYVAQFKSLSRVLTFIKNNTKLFVVTSSTIAINPAFDEYFNKNFIAKYDFEDLHNQLVRNVDYAYFLHNTQNFNINLVDTPDGSAIEETTEKITVSSFIDENEDENDYLEKVDSIDERNINDDVGKDAYKAEPVAVMQSGQKRKFRTNPLLGKLAIKKANYQCECDNAHISFISKKTKKSYMEAHHLIPVCFQKEMWDKYGVNIDCVENLVSLCPTCHKAFHYGSNEVKSKLIEQLFAKCAPKFRAIGLNISLEEIKKLYKV